MGFRQLLFLLVLVGYFLGLAYLIAKRPYEAFPNGSARNVARWLFFLAMAYVPAGMGAILFWGRPSTAWGNFFLGLVITLFFTQLTLIAYFLVVDLISLLRGAGRLVAGTEAAPASPSRRQLIRQVGLLLAAIPFSAYLHGITRGKYNYHVQRLVLRFPDLPEAFDGFKLAQISDLHTGSFDDINKVKGGVELLQAQGADVIVFTGDLVNSDADEATPFVPMFRDILQAPFGKFAVTGNHDYYGRRPDGGSDRAAPVKARYREMGFDLLEDRAVRIEKDGQQLYVVGVENWGKPPFPQIGDLDKALAQVPADGFKVLLSHDPTHWDEKTLPHPHRVHLTLSGHTHGMQMGVRVSGWQWSPASFIYPRWAGLYEEAGQYLYVNRGFGWLFFPGRVGMYPEITVFEFRREQLG